LLAAATSASAHETLPLPDALGVLLGGVGLAFGFLPLLGADVSAETTELEGLDCRLELLVVFDRVLLVLSVVRDVRLVVELRCVLLLLLCPRCKVLVCELYLPINVCRFVGLTHCGQLRLQEWAAVRRHPLMMLLLL